MKKSTTLLVDPDATEAVVYELHNSKAVIKNNLDEADHNSDDPEAIELPPVISFEELALLLDIPPRRQVHPFVEMLAKFFVTKILWKVQALRGTPLTK